MYHAFLSPAVQFLFKLSFASGFKSLFFNYTLYFFLWQWEIFLFSRKFVFQQFTRCSDFVGRSNNSKNHWRSFPNGFYTNLWLLCVLVAIVLVYAKNLSCQFDFFLGWSRYTFKTILDSKLFPFEYSECMVWKYIDTIYII